MYPSQKKQIRDVQLTVQAFGRNQRVISCRMHAFERILKPVFAQLLKDQGLKNSATVSQNIYSIAHYMLKIQMHNRSFESAIGTLRC